MWLTELIKIFSSIPFIILHAIIPNSFPKPLSKKEEQNYINLLKQKNPDAKKKLIKHNLRLVAHIAKKYYLSKNDPDDLISIGTIGLIKAINTFNPEKGIRLSSYASRCIENEILMYFRNSKKNLMNISINEPIETDKNGNVLTLMDTISTDDSIAEQIDTKINVQKLNNYINEFLNPREKIIICLRYGLCGEPPLPQREIAKRLNISRSYVSRIEKRALEILKNNFDNK